MPLAHSESWADDIDEEWEQQARDAAAAPATPPRAAAAPARAASPAAAAAVKAPASPSHGRSTHEPRLQAPQTGPPSHFDPAAPPHSPPYSDVGPAAWPGAAAAMQWSGAWLSLPHQFAHVPLFVEGQDVEVRRSTGEWTPAVVRSCDAQSCVVQISEQKTKTIPLRQVERWIRLPYLPDPAFDASAEWGYAPAYSPAPISCR